MARTIRESRRTSSTVMLQQTPRAGDNDMHEHSHLVPDAGELSAVAHTDDCCGPHGSHTRPLSECDAQCAAHGRPVHPLRIALRHCAVVAKQSCCTVEDVEIVNVGALKIQAHSGTRRDELYNFTQRADVGRASARPQIGPLTFLTLWTTHPCKTRNPPVSRRRG